MGHYPAGSNNKILLLDCLLLYENAVVKDQVVAVEQVQFQAVDCACCIYNVMERGTESI